MEKRVFLPRWNRPIVEMRDIGEGDPRDIPQLGRERMDVKIPGYPLVAIPLNIVGIGVDDEALAGAARSIDVQHP